jgi:tRNA pseudouridine38-40 synthase
MGCKGRQWRPLFLYDKRQEAGSMRFAAGVEYDGSSFLGWQRLPHGDTVQGAVERALSKVADAAVTVTCSGRTDSGVHARCQVIHFDIEAQRSTRALLLGTNSNLPDAVALRWVQPVDASFHARFSARARRYRYHILNREARPALERLQHTWVRDRLDADRMQLAAQHLLGEHDFTAFRTLACQAPSPVRTLHSLVVQREDDRVTIEVQANAFLHHMVRNIVGSLIPVGLGERSPAWLAELLAGRNRALAGPTAPAQGLLFVGPCYPDWFHLPAEVSLACVLSEEMASTPAVDADDGGDAAE